MWENNDHICLIPCRSPAIKSYGSIIMFHNAILNFPFEDVEKVHKRIFNILLVCIYDVVSLFSFLLSKEDTQYIAL